jgi:hypothetical protein
MEGDPETLDSTSPEEARNRESGVLSPEAVAKEFLREGAVIDSPRKARRQNRRTNARAAAATAAGIVCAAVVLAGLAAFTLLPNRQASPPVSHVAQHPTSTSVVEAPSSTTTSISALPDSAITVDVLNAYGSGQLATQTASSLRQLGFTVGHAVNAPTVIAPGNPSQILYGANGLTAADTLAKSLAGAVQVSFSPQLTGNHLQLWVANPQLTVNTSTTSTTASNPAP